jgi:hypothetical protein
MRVDLADIADFHRLAVPAYTELIGSGGPGRPRLEIVLAPGTYAGQGLTLGAPLTGQAIDVTLRGADPQRPPVLTDMSLALHARELRLADLVFESNARDLPLVRAAIETSIDITGCAFIGNRTSERAGGRLLQLTVADAPHATSATATVRNSWFIRNRAPQESALIAFDAMAPRSFARVSFDDVAFVDNAADCCIAAGLTNVLQLSRCVVYAPTTPDPARLFAAVSFVHTRVELGNSLSVGFGTDTLVSRWSASHPDARDFQPVGIRDSEIVEAPTQLDERVVDDWLGAARSGRAPDRQALAALV